MKILIIAIVLVASSCIVVGCGRRSGTSSPSRQQFVSMTCEKGDITLTLEIDNSFTLVLKHWDSKSNQHTHEDRTSGLWEKRGDQLILTATDSVLTYKPDSSSFTIGSASVSVEGYGWISSTKGTPFDTYSLVEKEKIDAFLLKAEETEE